MSEGDSFATEVAPTTAATTEFAPTTPVATEVNSAGARLRVHDDAQLAQALRLMQYRLANFARSIWVRWAMRVQSLTLLRMIWALPCSLVGAFFGLVVLILGGSLRRVEHTLEFALRDDTPALPRWAHRLGYEAITFGHVIIGQSHARLHCLRLHERVHVRQYERWGLLFLIAYPLASLHAWWRGGCPYRDNHFEIEAFASESRAETSDG